MELLPAGECQQERTGDIVFLNSIVSDERRAGTCDVGIQVGEGIVYVNRP